MAREYNKLRLQLWTPQKEEKRQWRDEGKLMTLMEAIATTQEAGAPKLFRIVRGTEARSTAIKTATQWRRLGEHQHALRKQLKHASLETMLTMLAEANDEIHHPEIRVKVTARIRKAMRRYLGIRQSMRFLYRYKYTDQIDIQRLKEYIIMIVNKSHLIPKLTEYIKSNLRLMPTNRKTIQATLISNKQTLNKWEGTEAPQCTCGTRDNTTHLQMEMKDMKGAAGKVGRTNTKLIPIPAKRETRATIIGILNSVTTTLATIKEHVSQDGSVTKNRLNPTQQLDTQDTVFDHKGHVKWTVNKQRIRDLYNRFMHTRNTLRHNLTFQDALEALHKRYKKSPRRAQWSMPQGFYKILNVHMHTAIERSASPLDFSKDIPMYNSRYKEDRIFNATYFNDNMIRVHEGVDHCGHTDEDRNRAITNAIIAAEKGVNTMLVITITEETEQLYMKLLHHAHVNPYMKWVNTFRFTSPKTNRMTTMHNKTVLFAYVTKQTGLTRWRAPKAMDEEINALSRKLFHTTPNTYPTLTLPANRTRKVAKAIREMNEKVRKFYKTYRHTEQNKHKESKIKRYEMTENELGLRSAIERLGMLTGEDFKNVIDTMMIPSESETDRREEEVTMGDIKAAKKQTAHLVVSPMDKNDTMLFCECPVAYHERMVRNLFKHDNFTAEANLTENILLEEFQDIYKKKNLSRFGRYLQSGRIPIAYVNPKYKAPLVKERLIASYRKHPLRFVLKKANKCLTFLFRQLPKQVKHFTLHRLDNLKTRVTEASTRLQKFCKEHKGSQPMVMATQTDITSMYTFLSQEGIMKAVKWMFRELGEQKQYRTLGKGMNRTPRKGNKNIISIINSTGQIDWGTATRYQTDEDTVTSFTFQDLEELIRIDINMAYTRVGQTIWKQRTGVPIGGLMSGILANIYCSYCEHKLTKMIQYEKKYEGMILVEAIRQMDDMCVWIAHKRGKGKALAREIKKFIIESAYGDGLVVEEQPQDVKQERTRFEHTFSGSTIRGNKRSGHLTMKAYNKNEISLEENGTQKFRRYPPYKSFTHPTYKRSTVIGQVIRTAGQNTEEKDVATTVATCLREFETIAYPRQFLLEIVRKMKRGVLNKSQKDFIRRSLTD
jgi:hypothetical protein